MKRQDPKKKKKIHTHKRITKIKRVADLSSKTVQERSGGGVENIFKVLKQKNCLPEFYAQRKYFFLKAK